jgi:catechol 2,3-dioxygenase-like lactoylglutathione lyase family enzyme
MDDVPKLFRVTLQVSDLEKAAEFYTKLLDTAGRRIPGSRYYFDCGPVILAVLDPSRGGEMPKPSSDYIYFSVKEIETIHARARELECLSQDTVHGESAGEIVTRPWGERSFYIDDPFGNRLCFVGEQTIYSGR